MKTNIWVVVGYSGSGKTTLTQKIGLKLGLPIVTYNQYLTELSHQEGYSHKNDYFRNTPVDEFKQALDRYAIDKINLFAETNNTFLVEGICSSDGFIKLRSNPSMCVRLFYIEVPEEERMLRVAGRDGAVFFPKERHKKMLGLDELVKMADYVIDGMKEHITSVDEKIASMVDDMIKIIQDSKSTA